ncbi:MAG: signal peptidase I [Candidatus Saccharibacteria bacterium]
MEQNQNPVPASPEKPGRHFNPVLMFALDFLKVVVIALAIILPIRYFIFQPFIVQGSSMEPNFSNGQYLIIDEISYRFEQPKRGDVLVLKYPNNPKEYFIKRIIGLPGEKVEIDNGKVTIFNPEHPNGVALDESYLPSQGLTFPHNSGLVGGKKTLELTSDEYFMMGDNRLASSDSRDWGPLNRNGIVGKVFVRALPLTDFTRFKTPAYSL